MFLSNDFAVRLRSLTVQDDNREMPATSPKTERSLCQPIPAPGAYSVTRTCWKRPGAMRANASHGPEPRSGIQACHQFW
nr:hypothetical protein CDS [Bradyrhizobium sp.]